ncbi:MAG: radical SAM/SPASM domain-containing protein [Polyangiaceae bacterium]
MLHCFRQSPEGPGSMYDVAQLIEEPELWEPLLGSLRELTPPAYLRSVKIKLTARCNLKCVMCRYGRGWTPPELPGERFIEVLAEMADLGCRKVHFSGGEVLSRKDFEAIAGAAAESGIKVTLTSNLTLLTKQRARSLLAHRISGISTSLDGASAKVHESVRGVPGSFKKTLRGIEYIARYARKRPPKLRVNFVMLRQNFRDYPALIRLVGERGAVNLVPMPVDSKNEDLRLSKRLIREYNEEIAPQVEELRRHYGFPLGNEYVYPFGRDKRELDASAAGDYALAYYQRNQCLAPWLHLFVAWDGKVYLCCMTNGRIEPLGDLATQSVREVWLGDAFQRIRAQMRAERIPSCHACDMYLTENRELNAALAEADVSFPATATPGRRLPLVSA